MLAYAWLYCKELVVILETLNNEKKGFLFLQVEEDACELKVGLRNPLQGQQPVPLQSTSPVSGWITQSEYLRRQSTSYFLSMRAVLLWNDFCTSVTYKNNHTLDIFILFCFFGHYRLFLPFSVTFQHVWLHIGNQG